MIRSQLASLVKQDIGLVLRRTSTKHRSMQLVVRTFFRWASGQAKCASSPSRSRSMLATAFGASAHQRWAHSQ